MNAIVRLKDYGTLIPASSITKIKVDSFSPRGGGIMWDVRVWAPCLASGGLFLRHAEKNMAQLIAEQLAVLVWQAERYRITEVIDHESIHKFVEGMAGTEVEPTEPTELEVTGELVVDRPFEPGDVVRRRSTLGVGVVVEPSEAEIEFHGLQGHLETHVLVNWDQGRTAWIEKDHIMHADLPGDETDAP